MIGAIAPAGFRYQSGFLSPEEEADIVARLANLPFRAFAFQGFLGKRRVVSFGWRYDFNRGGLKRTEPMPAWTDTVRQRAAAWSGVADFQQLLVTEYAPGAPIGWHRDRSVFAEVVGVSLLAPARMRFRRKAGTRWERAAALLEPRSIYLLSGPAREQWEHSIPPHETLRYSLTFRRLKA